ncbi:Transcription-silencing protein Clr2 [Teratosphaeria destructans]|uniref:Transcription-silencing protein Clr2 n=1 Tax=Teratosphaeria destructans TaxID=418781 RepID=A0A9W7SLQ3_9PEZI|nr:Transcription-silencing protein Clr2 [Teratosphaeria destructans]
MVQILSITGCSDGDGRRRPRTNDFTRNDQYWMEKIATEKWAKDLGIYDRNTTFRLDRLPDGYGGYEKARTASGNGSKHIDRYVYGHLKGAFRSLNEFYPHFKWLMEHNDAAGCTCKLCLGIGRSGDSTRRASGVGAGAGPSSGENGSRTSASATNQSPFFTQPKLQSQPAPGLEGMRQGRPPQDPPVPRRGRQVDGEGTTDALRGLIDRLKEAGVDGQVEDSIIETMSPDWRQGHQMLTRTLEEWRELPTYVPRQGELVLFVRHLGPRDTLGWDKNVGTYRIHKSIDDSFSDTPRWEAGVITQMPTEDVADEDLNSTPDTKRHSVVNAGFRIEPMSQVRSVSKPYSKQHKYVPLHAIRPLCLWQECLNGMEKNEWHATIRHALSVASSMCLIGRYYFKGTWPEAIVFHQGIFIGPELVMVGDVVRLQPRATEQSKSLVTDVLWVTAIKMKIVNLDEAGDDDQDNGHPYTTCIHISGKAFTLDPKRSYDGIGKMPIPSNSEKLPASLRASGTWYHISDPKKTKTRLEVPFTRVVGRMYDKTALLTWLPSSDDDSTIVSRGLSGIVKARIYSQDHDLRINKDNDKHWFWADTRVEQLDLHEVNGKAVGVKDEERKREMADWRRALKALDGSKSGLEAYHAARRQREEAAARAQSTLGASASGLVAGAAQAIDTDVEPIDVIESGAGDALDGDEDEGEDQDVMEVDPPSTTLRGAVPMRKDSSGSEMDVDAGNALAAFKQQLPATQRAGGSFMIDSDDEDDFMRG